MFGSDWPFSKFEDKVKYADTLDFFKSAIPDQAVRNRVGGETALKFYCT